MDATNTPRGGSFVFRLWTADDLPLARMLWADPQVTQLVADLGNPSEEQARERLARELANWQSHRLQYWPVFLPDGAFLGCAGLRPYRPDDGFHEVGVHLLPKHWGRSLGTELVRCVVAHAFGVLGARGLFARHNPHNHGSDRILARLGFRHTHNELMPQTGLNHPCYLLTADEWSGRT